MNKRTRTILRLLLAGLFIPLWMQAADAKPNIIFILADDLGYGEVGVYGQKKILTPSLDNMAAEGMRFTSHFSGGPVCGPSRACLMTGQSQAIGFIKGNPGGNPDRENLRVEDTTVAEVLKEAGYDTAMIGKWGLGKRGNSGYPTNKGFDYFLGYDTHVSAHNYYPKALCENDGKRVLKGNLEKKNKIGKVYTHDVFTEQALKFISEKRDAPYFLYLGYTIPHSPFNPPDVKPYEDKDWSSVCKKYAAMITRMDRDIGKILDSVNEAGQNTIVIFTSDNGPQSSGTKENGLTTFFDSNGEQKGIKRDVYNGGIREPFIAWWPGKIAPNSVSSHISSFQDFMPTACELAGIPVKTKTDGLSYLPTLLGQDNKQAKHEWLYWEFIYMARNKTGRQCVLNPKIGFKAVRFGRHSPVELYRFDEDVSETDDVASQYPEIAAKMTKYLDTCRTESELWPITFHDTPKFSTFSPHYKGQRKIK